MPFTEEQKTRFVELLETKGWQMRDGTIWSAGGGLWFSNSHFADWTPSQMQEIFAQRAERIAKAELRDWQRLSRENQEASSAAEAVVGI